MSRQNIDYRTQAEPKAMAGQVPVFCSHDEILETSKLVPNPKNPNKHPDKQVKLLAEIIKAQGWRQPITISKRSGFIVKGHGRLMAAQLGELGYVPVDYQNYASEAEEYADLTADNRIAELAEMDNIMLAEILSDIDTGELPLILSGYDEDDLEGMLDAIAGADDAEPNDQDDEVEQKATTTLTKLGDLWEMGGHRLIIGDATDENTIKRLMNGEKGHMVHTDPPYGVSYESQSGNFGVIMNDTKTGDDLLHTLLLPTFNNYRKHTIDEAAFYIWHAGSTRRDFEDAMTAAGLAERQYLIWAKNGLSIGGADYQHSHEPCFYAHKAGIKPHFYGDRAQHDIFRVTTRANGQMMTVLGNGVVVTDGKGGKLCITDKPAKGKKYRYIRLEDMDKSVDLYQDDHQSTVWEVSRETGYLHPTQKPVELTSRAIENSSQPGEIVLDFFGGSGSTLLGAELTGRRCYTTELDPQYGDVIVSRYVMETGNIGITCERDGKTMTYMELVREWAKENGKEQELEEMKIPVVVAKKVSAKSEEQEG